MFRRTLVAQHLTFQIMCMTDEIGVAVSGA